MTPMLALGTRLQALRQARGLTQETLAKHAGLSLGFVGRIEIGLHDPSVSTLLKLAKGLKVGPSELLP
jgi:transcriptional regulator with XRE-family HTH domain